MNLILESFAPIADEHARLLILGSMPGVASLRAAQYYAHPQNQFWQIMGAACRFDPALPYLERVRCLQNADVAVWDVLASCRRPGSLDAHIEPASVVANDFVDFLAEHPKVRRVCFNGATAETLFKRHVRLQLGALGDGIEWLRLPSTSPAHAALSLSQKQECWLRALRLSDEQL